MPSLSTGSSTAGAHAFFAEISDHAISKITVQETAFQLGIGVSIFVLVIMIRLAIFLVRNMSPLTFF